MDPTDARRGAESPTSRDDPGVNPGAAAQVCLVHMPYGQLALPSLALGLLKVYLRQVGITATVVYANIDCATDFGLDVYEAIENTEPESLIGEWTFAAAAFGDSAPDPEPFLATVAPGLSTGWFKILQRLHPRSNPLRVLAAVREHAGEFVDNLARRILSTAPRIVGCTSTFQQHCASLALLRRIKELSPATVTMLGGGNCEGVMGETTHRAFPWVDVVMSGEVDAFVGPFCRAILDRGLAAASREAPEGVFCRDHRQRTTPRLAPPRAVLHAMDQAATPEYDDYFEALRRAPFGDRFRPGVTFESSRGCWWGMKHHCTFCGLNGEGMVFRVKSPSRILDEITELYEKYRTSWLQAVDNILEPSLLKSVMPELAARPDHPYLFYEVKANLKQEHLDLMSRAGVKRIQPGIESLHDEALALMDKGNRWFTNVQLLRWSRQAGISVTWNFLCGIPGEHDEWYSEVAKWLPAIYHLEPPQGIPSIRYDRFSPYHDRPQDYGLSLVPNRAYRLVYPVGEEMLRGLAYCFEDTRTLDAPPTAGSVAISRLLEGWRQAFAGGNGARLSARDVEGRLIVHDTRALGNDKRLVFTGLERAILLACDSARTRRGLEHALRAEGHGDDSGRIDDCLERLQRQHLLLDSHGHILSLYVSEPISPLIPADGQLGLINAASWLNQARERSIAARSIATSNPPRPMALSVATSQA